jgi:ribonucleoside-diphosphate reductase alpha chain
MNEQEESQELPSPPSILPIPPILKTEKKQFFNDNDMFVTKRNGKVEPVSFDKILKRIKRIGQNENIKINYTNLAIKVIDQLYDKISTTQIDELSAEQCASMVSIHPDYYILSSKLIIINHHKNTPSSFSKSMTMLYKFKDHRGKHHPLLAEDIYEIINKNSVTFDALCGDCSRDFLIDYFGFKTLERSYLMRINQKIVERPQYMWLRVSIGIHKNDIEKVIETYHLMSQKYFTHATPTLFNSGTPHPQNSSCYLIAMESDSIEGIYNTLKDCALISKWAGGIGVHIHNVRAQGSQIRGTNGVSNGIVPMLKVFNNTAKYVDQCVHPETIIYTTMGPMQIQHVSSNETQIFNINGEVEIIQNVLEHVYQGNVYKIYTSNCSTPLIITPEHPMFILHNPEGMDINRLKERVLTETLFDWVDVSNITKNDMIIYPIPKYNKDISTIDFKDCYVYGLILSNGSMRNNSEISCIISLDLIKNKNTIDFLKTYFTEKNVKYNFILNGNTMIIYWNRTIELPFRYNDIYNNYNKKYVNSKWLNLPIDKSKYILKGLLNVSLNDSSEIVFNHSSSHLIDACQFLCLKMGILTKHLSKTEKSIQIQIPKTPEICELTECIIENDTPPQIPFFKFDNFILTSIQNIETAVYNGVLYDLQLKTEHNYLLQNGLVHNGGGRRNGSIAVYIEPWHADIELFLEMRKNHGDEEMKARDLFYALWIPDLFMERIKTGGIWTLMCPDECPGLSDVYGEAFNKLYEKYENESKGKKTMNARDLWFQILDAQMETGTPYILYKDSANKKSNQQNIGTIKSSNLCVAPETLVLTDKGHIEIRKLENQTVNVWNGYEFSSVTVFKTGSDQELIDIETDDGCVLTCTKYHKFFIQEREGEENIKTIEAQNLNIGDCLKRCNFPIIDNNIFEEDYMPSQNAINEKMSWFTTYCEKSNIAFENNTIICTSIHILLIKIKLMLQTCGINPIIFRYDNNFNICKLFISKKEIQQLILLGFNPTNINLNEIKKEMKYSDSSEPEPVTDIVFHLNTEETEKTTEIYNIDFVRSKHIPNYVTIKNINNRGRIDDTYCFNEPKRNSAIFNGILTSQCTEILQYSDDKETAVCNLASIALPAFVETKEDETIFFNHSKLHDIVRVVTYNLNKIIDINFYPTEKTKTSNMRHRPIGIGVQGLADVFMMMNLPFTSNDSKLLNQEIFETIYHAALEESCELSKTFGSYETFVGSPASIGILQFDLWNKSPGTRYDWNEMKNRIKINGLRNSLLLAPMPTASTSQILGYNECFEPITSNIYSRRTLAGEFIVANKYLMKDMLKLGLWNEKIKNNIIANNGSIQNIDVIPLEIREKYKTVWEIPMRDLIDMSADRGIYICQSQSLNLWLEDPNYNTLTSMHFYSWSKGLKTGIYYLRRRARHQAQQFTVEPEKPKINENENDICEMCTS